jgi:uncharacterized protein (TIGR02391 family)
MILKTFAEIDRPGSPVHQKSRQYRGVICDVLPLAFEIDKLTYDEQEEGIRAIVELLRDGFLVQDPRFQSEGTLKLTKEGRETAEKCLDDMSFFSISLQDLLSHKDLRNKVRDDFYAGEYESVVLKAFKMVEEAVRHKAGLTANDFGREMINKAFSEKSPLLNHPEAKTSGEKNALLFLMSGAYGWFRNPASHRTVAYLDIQQAAHILSFANLLLDMIDRCKP